ncbi:hypothetical protein GCM10007415_11290 [Parapedobacter pyrenivorans]|uniref:Uncharacterized protein n=1 Tax=Parapedobacter pyrenivorans TaxID=1305674 RepID=A0A917HJ32_9SPHI|nr:hypothetical protein [Parapedobacter pyrenivorans]GGG80571.1 hypothetical protein GCM10007415_11290 [Parapedobacter pyrenivorans]
MASHYHRDNNGRQKSPAKRFLSVLGLFMFGLYLVLGLVVIFWKDFPLELDRTYRVLFGVLLVVYSFFRFVRLWQNR